MKNIILVLGLFLTLNSFAGKLQNEDFKSSAELVSAGGTAAQLLNDTKIYVTANGLNKQLSSAISNGDLGGGGGGSLQWVEGLSAPIALTDSVGNRTYSYQSGLSQALTTVVKVPSTWGGGTQLKLLISFYSPDLSGTALLQTVATLNRPGTDAYTSVANQRTSTNTAVTLGAGTVNIPQLVTLDLTDSTGKINGVSVVANNLIFITLKRGSDTATSDLQALVYGAEQTLR